MQVASCLLQAARVPHSMGRVVGSFFLAFYAMQDLDTRINELREARRALKRDAAAAAKELKSMRQKRARPEQTWSVWGLWLYIWASSAPG